MDATIPESAKKAVLLKRALYIVSALVIGSVAFVVLRNFWHPSAQTALTPAQELALQEQIAPLIKAGDMAACNQVQNALYRAVCIDNIAMSKAQQTQDISWCQYLDSNLVSIESCEQPILFAKAAQTGDETVCSETQDKTLQDECRSNFFILLASKEQNPNICDRQTDPTKADQCWNEFYVRKSLTATTSPAKSLDCSVFRGSAVQADCSSLKKAFSTNNPQTFSNACQSQKTTVFRQICMAVLGQGI